MYDNYIRLELVGGSTQNSMPDAYILALKADVSRKYFPVLVDKDSYFSVFAALEHKDFTRTVLMNRLAKRMGMKMVGVRILEPSSGDTKALIDFAYKDEVVSITTPICDALIACFETGTDIWVQRDFFVRFTSIQSQGANGVALPATALNDHFLEMALKNAVETENFELAGALKQILLDRKQSSTTDNNAEAKEDENAI